MEGTSFDTAEAICAGWQKHFEDLSTPKQIDSFDYEYQDRVSTDMIHIEEICRLENQKINPASFEEVRNAIKRLKNNKAADSFGLTSEHIINCKNEIIPYLVDLVNTIFRIGKIPDTLKEGLHTPVYKKGDSANPSNYRGISVTPILLKVVEHILNTRQKPLLEPTQSVLQKGFTENTSSMNAAMVLSECINDSNHQKKPLFIAALDVQKAFDVVSHSSLLRKLYIDGISGDDWLLMKDLYSGMTARVKWDGFLSSPFVIKQGVRQGGILSASHYKRYNNPLMIDVEDRFRGKRIGTVKIPHISVADDMCFVTEHKEEIQPMVSTSEAYANREHYTIHPTKTVAVQYNYPDSIQCMINGKTVPRENKTTHLGIERNTKCQPNTDEKVNLGRRTAYSLMGAGFHGKSGLKQCIKADMWRKYVVPRLIYGLEVHNLRKKDLQQLEAFQRRNLKQLQGLPIRAPDTASLALIGMLPVGACIEKNALTLFCNIARDQSCIENQIATRQLAVRDITYVSWFSTIRKTLNMYDLPSAYELLENPPTKEKWKCLLKEQIHGSVEESWRNDIASKSSLKYLNPESVKVGKVHQIYSSVRSNTLDVRRAEVKARLLTGTYTLQSNRAKFNQYKVSPTCQLCKVDPETREHF